MDKVQRLAHKVRVGQSYWLPSLKFTGWTRQLRVWIFLEPARFAGMLRFMKRILFIVCLAWNVGNMSQAENSKPASGVVPQAADGSKPIALSPDESAQYGEMRRGELEFNAKLKLLAELSDEHAKRADAAKTETSDKVKWETDLVQELRDRATRMAKQLSEVTTQRLAFEAAHSPPPGPAVGLGSLETTNRLNMDEIAYLTKIEQRLSKVADELASTLETTRSYTAELATNRAPEDVGRISRLLEVNGRQLKELEREQVGLDLRKLEFRALRK